MSRRPNRIVLVATGLVLAAAGAVPLLAAAGLLAVPEPGRLSDQLSASARTRPELWTAGAVVAGLLAAAVGMWLVRRQFRIRPGGRLGAVTLTRGERGRTTVEASAVARTAAADLRGTRGVGSSHVRMLTYGPRPRLRVHLVTDADIEPRVVLERAEAVYQRVCRLLDTQDVHVDTVVQPTGQPSGRVR